MAFSVGTAQAELGPQLPEITTMVCDAIRGERLFFLVFTDGSAQEVGFKGVDRDCRIQFLPNAWPADALPPPTCSLLAVASNQGIVVAGGPDCLVVSTTKSVRDAISAKTDKGVKVKPFEPQAKIPVVKRPMQVAFCSAESALALSTVESNQLLIYETSTLLQENPQPKLFIPTNAPLRALAPNPAPLDSANSGFVAMTTVNGSLLIADLRIGSLVSGPNGPVLKDGVSCISWSNKGRQLVAGLADGTCYQMTPEGVRKDEIPRPPDIDVTQHGKSSRGT
jgi:nucleoporin NUP159